MAEDKKAKVLKTIAKALGVKRQLKDNDSMLTVGEWDSLAQLEVLTALDKEFKGKVANIDEMSGATSIKKILQLLRREKLV